jgi:predicted DNA-binding mobile mystery protein A
MPKTQRSPELLRLRTRQLQDRLGAWNLVKKTPPRDGWIKTVREALGMSGTQLARRMGVDPAALSRLEAREVKGKVTLEYLQKAAEAMNSRLVYAIVPNESLTATVRQQAAKKARAILRRVGHTMALEAQGVDPDEAARQEAELLQRLLMELPRSLWDEDDDHVNEGQVSDGK